MNIKIIVCGCLFVVFGALSGTVMYVKHQLVSLNEVIDANKIELREQVDLMIKFQKQVSVLEESIGPRDKRWARIKQVRSVIQEDLRSSGYGKSLNINDITLVASSIVDYSDEFDVPSSLIAAIMRSESAYNPMAISKAGARGIMQIMKYTADEIAMELGVKYYNIHKISDNSRFGTYYLWKMLKIFNGDVELSIRAYNCGPQWVTKVVAGDYPDYPQETVNYLKKVLVSKKMFEDAGL